MSVNCVIYDDTPQSKLEVWVAYMKCAMGIFWSFVPFTFQIRFFFIDISNACNRGTGWNSSVWIWRCREIIASCTNESQQVN